MIKFSVSKLRSLAIGLFLIATLNSFSQEAVSPNEETIYKQIDTVKLKMVIYNPTDFKTSDKHPAFVFFFGGGWNKGNVNQFKGFAQHYASKGMVAILVDYRVKTRQGTTPFESLKDAKSAIRYVRKNAGTLGIDPQRIVASGGSAGGHLAAACFTNETINEEGDDLSVNAKPNALVLLNPVIDNSKDGYGYDRVGERYLEFSPLHNIHKGFPPTILFLGTKDKLIPVSTAELFKQKIVKVGGRCDLVLYDGQEHSFFNKKIFHDDILIKVDSFLQQISYLDK